MEMLPNFRVILALVESLKQNSIENNMIYDSYTIEKWRSKKPTPSYREGKEGLHGNNNDVPQH